MAGGTTTHAVRTTQAIVTLNQNAALLAHSGASQAVVAVAGALFHALLVLLRLSGTVMILLHAVVPAATGAVPATVPGAAVLPVPFVLQATIGTVMTRVHALLPVHSGARLLLAAVAGVQTRALCAPRIRRGTVIPRASAALRVHSGAQAVMAPVGARLPARSAPLLQPTIVTLNRNALQQAQSGAALTVPRHARFATRSSPGAVTTRTPARERGRSGAALIVHPAARLVQTPSCGIAMTSPRALVQAGAGASHKACPVILILRVGVHLPARPALLQARGIVMTSPRALVRAATGASQAAAMAGARLPRALSAARTRRGAATPSQTVRLRGPIGAVRRQAGGARLPSARHVLQAITGTVMMTPPVQVRVRSGARQAAALGFLAAVRVIVLQTAPRVLLPARGIVFPSQPARRLPPIGARAKAVTGGAPPITARHAASQAPATAPRRASARARALNGAIQAAVRAGAARPAPSALWRNRAIALTSQAAQARVQSGAARIVSRTRARHVTFQAPGTA